MNRSIRLAASLLATALSAQTPVPTESAAEIDAALARYRELALPEPPANAPFVLLQSAGMGFVNGVRQESPLHPAFRLAPGADGEQRHLRGTVIDDWRYRLHDAEPLTRPLDLGKLEPSRPFDDFARDQGLAIGLQLWARGARDHACQLLELGAGDQRLADRVALLAANHWHAQILESEVPLAELQRRLQAAVALLPASLPAGSGHPIDAKPVWAQLLDRLERTTRAPQAPVDPMTALVLDLVHSRRPGGIGGSNEPDAPFEAVVRRGFAIVPALIAHLDDDRITRAKTQGFNNFRSYIRPLGELAGDALQQIAGGKLPTRGIVTQIATRAAAEAWWEETRHRKEDEYALECFLAAPTTFMNQGPLLILAAKFPERLELAVIELVAQHPERVTTLVIDRIADGSMHRARKIALLERLAATRNLRLHALRRLADLDEPRFCELFLAVLQHAPPTTPPSVWQSPDATFGHLVVLTERPEVWHEFLRAARRAEVGLRMEYLSPFTYTYLGNRQRHQRIACLAAFLDDEERYDVAASGQDGPHAAFVHRQLTMRDYAASKLAALLGLARHGGPDWNSEQWTALRDDVRQALAKEGIAPLQLPAAGGK
jgi:hypothetical protein